MHEIRYVPSNRVHVVDEARSANERRVRAWKRAYEEYKKDVFWSTLLESGCALIVLFALMILWFTIGGTP